MSSPSKSLPVHGDYFLSLLPSNTHAALAPMLEPVQLGVKQKLHERGEPFSSDIYFPTTCLLSAILPLIGGSAVEVGSVGNEGFSGVEMLTGARSPINTYLCQVPGKAMRMSVVDFKHALETMPELRKLAFDYLHCFMALMAQSAACNSQHSTEARFARWMLIVHDRVAGDDFKLTQEVIAQMLGVHRSSVSLLANQFQRTGMIQYSWGDIRILNRQGIEELACECYFDVRSRLQEVMGIQYR